MDRQGVGVLLAAGALLLGLSAAPKDLSSSRGIFSHGAPPHSEPQIVGAVTDTTAKVSFRTTGAANVFVEYSPDPALVEPVLQSQIYKTNVGADFTTHVSLVGLAPETTYYYRIVVNGAPQQIAPYPSFRTFPPAGSVRDFVFAVVSDTEHIADENGAPVYEEIESENPAFVIQIGDFDHSIPLTLQDMRSVHRSVRDPSYPAGADFVEHIAKRFPFFHTWDDHDYGTNDSDKTFPGRADALQAFREYYPLPDDAPNPAGIWHRFSYAQAEFYMLDLRSQRDPNLSPPGPQKSMLDGDQIPNGQKQWLKDALLQSTATWKFILTSVPFNPTSKTIPKDAWSGFGNERAELIDYIQLHEIRGIIFVSGDLHSGGGIDDGTNSAFPEINVPHTNMPDGDSGTLGTWSEGIISGKQGRSGYALIHVTMNPLNQVLLEAKGREGGARVSYLVH